MGYTRFIRVTNNKGERHQLAVMANFAEMNYSVVIVQFNHVHTRLEHHVVETFPTIYQATRAFNHHIAKSQQDPKYYQKIFETAKEKSKLYI